jgi:hypothetical protein
MRSPTLSASTILAWMPRRAVVYVAWRRRPADRPCEMERETMRATSSRRQRQGRILRQGDVMLCALADDPRGAGHPRCPRRQRAFQSMPRRRRALRGRGAGGGHRARARPSQYTVVRAPRLRSGQSNCTGLIPRIGIIGSAKMRAGQGLPSRDTTRHWVLTV